VAKGIRRTRSKFGARLEPFGHVDIQLHEGRSLDVVTQVEALGLHGSPLAEQYSAYTAGTAILETAERLTPVEREPSTQLYLLLVGGLRALVAAEHDPGLVLDAFLLRSLATAGYAPSFDVCTRCGAEGPHRFFSVAAGGSVCSTCRPPGSVTVGVPTLNLLGALLSGDWDTADGSETRHRREGSGLTAAYLQWHLERGLRSLRLVERT
jgi:DNA repair protein RecO (recombination protein O)